MEILKFWIKLTQKGYFPSKKEENHHQILYIQISLGSQIQPQQTILIFLEQICPKKDTLGNINRKNGYHQ